MATKTFSDLSPEHRQLLKDHHFAMLTTVRPDGLLSTNPVGFVFDGSSLKVSTLKSRMKFSNLQADPRITVCVQSFSNPMLYVEIRGRAQLHDDPDRAFFNTQFRDGTGEDPPENMDAPGAQRVVIEVMPEQISTPQLYGGRFDKE